MIKQFEVCIEKDTKEGVGEGLYKTPAGHTQRLHIPFTTAGDKVTAEIASQNDLSSQGRLLSVILPSAERSTARCVHYQTCGGCSLQHVTYSRTLALKSDYVRQCFSSLLQPETIVYPIHPSPEQWRYRNKMDYTFAQDKQKNKFLGLRMCAEKRKVLPLSECHLANAWFIEALQAIRQWWNESTLTAYHPASNQGALRSVTMREGIRSGDRLVMLTVSGNPAEALTKLQLDAFVAAVRQSAELPQTQSYLSIFLRLQHVSQGEPTTFYEMLLFGPQTMREVFRMQPFVDMPAQMVTFHINPTTFFQPNTLLAEQLYARLVQMADVGPDKVVYDFFSGPGTLGICIAPYVKKVISVEISPETALNARTNMHLNHIKNHTVVTSAVRHIVPSGQSLLFLEQPHLITVAPPRAGLDSQSLQTLLDLKAEKILYTSCNPKSQVQNLFPLLAAGYRLHSIQPMDQFPQTSHVTNIALLLKSI